MFNNVLYAIFRNPALVRLAKGAIAVGVSAAVAFLVKGIGDTNNGVPEIIILVGTPILLALDKFIQGWGKP